jgi:hypothetical protein
VSAAADIRSGMRNQFCFYYFFILIINIILPCIGDDIDWLFMSQRNFNSAQMKGLGDAGAALPGDVGVGRLNPALLHSSVKNSQGAISLGYGRDSLFDRHIMPLGFGYTGSDGAMGTWYRYQKGNNGAKQNELVVNFSGLFFKQIDEQGPVDFGVNFRYEWMERSPREQLMLPVEHYTLDSSGSSVYQSTVDSEQVSFKRDINERRFIVDIGFYQPNVMKNVDFAFVMHNLFGHRWTTERPSRIAVNSLLEDSLADGDTIRRIERHYTYENEEHTSKSWLRGRYRTLLFGVAYRVDAGSLQLIFPMDFEILGLFEKKIETRYVFRGGISALIGNVFMVRAGYARQPKTILEGLTPFKNANFFTGGVGVALTPIVLDVYFADNAFGMTVEYRY